MRKMHSVNGGGRGKLFTTAEVFFVAESEGFEPPIRFPVFQFSRLAPSTTRPTLHTGHGEGLMEE